MLVFSHVLPSLLFSDVSRHWKGPRRRKLFPLPQSPPALPLRRKMWGCEHFWLNAMRNVMWCASHCTGYRVGSPTIPSYVLVWVCSVFIFSARTCTSVLYIMYVYCRVFRHNTSHTHTYVHHTGTCTVHHTYIHTHVFSFRVVVGPLRTCTVPAQ